VEHVFSVQPPHLNHVALTQAVGMQIGQHHIVSTQHVLVKASQKEILYSTVPPTMNDECRFLATMMDIKGMMPLACRHDDKRVTQCPYTVQAVYPWFGIGVAFEQLVIAGVHICLAAIWRQRITQHIETCSDSNHQEQHYYCHYAQKTLFHTIVILFSIGII